MTPRRDWTEARRKVDREGECRWCGSRQDLEAAHIVSRSLGGTQTADAIVPLCSTDHRRFDAHEIDLIGALSFAEQAEAVRVIGIERARERLAPSAYPSKRVERAA